MEEKSGLEVPAALTGLPLEEECENEAGIVEQLPVSYRDLRGRARNTKKPPGLDVRRSGFLALNKHLTSSHRKSQETSRLRPGAFSFPCPELESSMLGTLRQGRSAGANHGGPVCVSCMS